MTEPVAALRQALAGRYAIERELGGGGMSRVYLAQETALGRQVVVKVIAPGLAEGLSADRFAREVKLAARLQQANIVPVLAAGEAAGLPYYTMPFVDGLSLRARLAQGVVPLGDAMGILRDVARALAYAHAQGVVHRDIKPENILLSHGAAVVTDFGIAKAISAALTGTGDGSSTGTLTQAGTTIGTPAYMAPEQAVGAAVDHRADLYAWGLVAYELLAGTHPFAGKHGHQQVIAAQIVEDPAPLAARSPALPPGLASLVMQCLAKDPAARPATADAVLAGLDAAGTPAPAPALPRAPKSRRLVVGLAGAVLVIAVALGIRAITRPAPGPSAEYGRSLAVLPFASVGGDTANAYVGEGIADELTTVLARVPGLRLAGRISAARLKASGATPQEVGATLKVSAVLGGTVRRSNARMRVSAELTDAADGRILWKETYERPFEDVFTVQDDIARQIASALQIRLGASGAPMPAAGRGTANPVAYDLYLRGLQLYRRRGPGLAKAEEYLAQAITMDPNFASAHAALAMVLMVQPYTMARKMGALLPRAREAAERAVELDDALPDAHLALGQVHMEAFEWPESERELRQAIALDPTFVDGEFRLGFLLMHTGRLREAVAALERARGLDPFYGVLALRLGWALALSGRAEEGVLEARRGFELDSTSEFGWTILTRTLMASGRWPEAGELALAGLAATESEARLGWYVDALAAGGRQGEAEAIVHRLEALPAGTWGRDRTLAYAYLGIRDTARALARMEHAAAGDGDLLLSLALADPLYDQVRGSARFVAILRRFNLDVRRFTRPDGGRSE